MATWSVGMSAVRGRRPQREEEPGSFPPGSGRIGPAGLLFFSSFFFLKTAYSFFFLQHSNKKNKREVLERFANKFLKLDFDFKWFSKFVNSIVLVLN
jgi:hypothetical protein